MPNPRFLNHDQRDDTVYAGQSTSVVNDHSATPTDITASHSGTATNSESVQAWPARYTDNADASKEAATTNWTAPPPSMTSKPATSLSDVHAMLDARETVDKSFTSAFTKPGSTLPSVSPVTTFSHDPTITAGDGQKPLSAGTGSSGGRSIGTYAICGAGLAFVFVAVPRGMDWWEERSAASRTEARMTLPTSQSRSQRWTPRKAQKGD